MPPAAATDTLDAGTGSGGSPAARPARRPAWELAARTALAAAGGAAGLLAFPADSIQPLAVL